jgi:cadmium resistance protein CadD (predicted permease)
MQELIALVGLGAVVFASTNIDDMFILIGFFADPKFRTRHIVAGQYLGIGALVTASIGAALISLVIPAAYVGLLGLLPIALGLEKAWKLWRGQEVTEEELKKHPGTGAHNILAVASITLANGSDNIGVYTPLFAIHGSHAVIVILATFAVMTAVWCFAARWLVLHPLLGNPIRRCGHRVLPFVLIGLGVLILYESGTITLLTGGN